MASEYDGATAVRQLEPPGFMGLNYGHRTPVTTLLGKAVYAVLGGMPKLQAALSDKRSWSDCCRRGTRLSELCRWSAARMLAAPPGASSPPALLSSLRLRLSGRARFQDAVNLHVRRA